MKQHPCDEDEIGMIWMDPDPHSSLSIQLSSALERYILGAEYDQATARIDAVRILLSEWNTLGDKIARSKWRRDYGESDFVLTKADDGSWQICREHSTEGDSDSCVSVPSQLLSVLYREVLLQPDETMIIRSESVDSLAREWLDLFTDEEKLLGHLLLAHEESWPLSGDNDALLALHGQHHRAHQGGS